MKRHAQPLRPALMALVPLLALAWPSAAVWAAPPVQRLSLSCEVAYMPARSTWVREVEFEFDTQAQSQAQSQTQTQAPTLLALRIDGLVPHSFEAHADGVLTAIDNERIQIDWRQGLWRSDFRGLATGQGRCESD
jgi:hypothetical protein